MSALLKYTRFLTASRILIEPCRLAGHSKWQNIRHTKASNDAKRSATISKYCLAVRKACLAGGGGDPKLNSALANVLAAAQKENVPKDTLMRQIDKFNNVQLKKHLLEIVAPGSIFVIVEVETDDIARTRHDLKKCLKKLKGSKIAREGTIKHSFEEKGQVKISRNDTSGAEISFERAEEIAIESGAEEVRDEEDGTWTLYTTPLELFDVKSHIERALSDIEIVSCDTIFLPVLIVPVDDELAESVSTFVDTLNSMDGVNRVYANV